MTTPDKRYAPMSPGEFAALRKETDAELDLNNRGAGIGGWWARRLSRALDVIERVTGERDRCTQARIEQQPGYYRGYHAGLNEAYADEAERMRLQHEAARPLPKGAGYAAIARGKLLLAPDAVAVEMLINDARRTVVEASANVTSTPEAEIAKEILRQGGALLGCPKCKAQFRMPLSHNPGVACPVCGYAWDEVSLLPKREAPVEPPEPEKHCGTCEHGQEYDCACVRISTKVTMRSGSDDGGYLTRDDGPPWENCRFWKPRV